MLGRLGVSAVGTQNQEEQWQHNTITTRGAWVGNKDRSPREFRCTQRLHENTNSTSALLCRAKADFISRFGTVQNKEVLLKLMVEMPLEVWWPQPVQGAKEGRWLFTGRPVADAVSAPVPVCCTNICSWEEIVLLHTFPPACACWASNMAARKSRSQLIGEQVDIGFCS